MNVTNAFIRRIVLNPFFLSKAWARAPIMTLHLLLATRFKKQWFLTPQRRLIGMLEVLTKMITLPKTKIAPATRWLEY